MHGFRSNCHGEETHRRSSRDANGRTRARLGPRSPRRQGPMEGARGADRVLGRHGGRQQGPGRSRGPHGHPGSWSAQAAGTMASSAGHHRPGPAVQARPAPASQAAARERPPRSAPQAARAGAAHLGGLDGRQGHFDVVVRAGERQGQVRATTGRARHGPHRHLLLGVSAGSAVLGRLPDPAGDQRDGHLRRSARRALQSPSGSD